MDMNKAKKVRKITIIVTAALAIMMLLCMALNSGVVGLLFFPFIISFIVMVVSIKLVKNKTCKKCKESLGGAEYDYNLVSQSVNDKGSETAKVRINAICPKCGTEKIIHKNFCIYNAEKGVSYDLQSLVDNACREIFEH